MAAEPASELRGNRRGRETRDRIDLAAERCFAEHGLQMTLDQVASAAGTTRMTIHRHTGGRGPLITKLLLRSATRLASEVAIAFERPGPFRRQLVDGLVATVLGVRSAPHLASMFTAGHLGSSWPAVDPDQEVVGQIHQFFGAYLDRAAARGDLRCEVLPTLDFLLQQVLVNLMLPDAKPTDAALRKLFEEFVLPSVLTDAALHAD